MPRRTFRKRAKTTRRIKRAIRRAKPVGMMTKTFKTPKGPWRKFNSVDPFPLQYNTKFVYASDYTLTSNNVQRTVGTIQEYRLNSPYDPDFTSVGAIASNTSAYAFAELLGTAGTGPYTRYKVNGVKIDLMWYDPSADGLAVISHIKSHSDGYAISTKDVQYLERAPMTCVNRMNDSGSQKKHMVQYFPLNQLCGWNKLQYNADNDFSCATYNTNPTLAPRLQLGVANNVDATQQTVRVRVKITYYTTCFGRYAQTGKEGV